LLAHRDYIPRDKPKTADKWLRGIKRRIDLLRFFPWLGEVIPEALEFGLEIRHLVYGNYRIFYLFVGERVSIVRIIQAARQIRPEMFGLGQLEEPGG